MLDGPGGRCVGQLGKNLLLKFLGDFLHDLVTRSSFLSIGGRAFSYELNGLLTGVSHGAVFTTAPNGSTFLRLATWQSDDRIIASVGQKLRWLSENDLAVPSASNDTVKFAFHLSGQDYEHLGHLMILPYGLLWRVSVVISLTQLFADINDAASKMLAY
eukprot:RCo040101